jgi:hypothetical protein
MTFRRRQRWLRRLALGFAFATALFAGKVSAAAAVVDEGGSGTKAIQVIPYLSHGVLTQEQADATQATPSGDELAFRNAIASQDPYLTDVFVRQGESQGGPDGAQPYSSQGILGEAVKSRQPVQPISQREMETLATSKATATATRPDDRADRFTGVEQPPVISYLSQGMAADGEVGARPDNRADRFAHSDVPTQPELASGGWNVEWNEALSVGIGALVLVLALGLGLGYLRRPRIAL